MLRFQTSVAQAAMLSMSSVLEACIWGTWGRVSRLGAKEGTAQEANERPRSPLSPAPDLGEGGAEGFSDEEEQMEESNWQQWTPAGRISEHEDRKGLWSCSLVYMVNQNGQAFSGWLQGPGSTWCPNFPSTGFSSTFPCLP